MLKEALAKPAEVVTRAVPVRGVVRSTSSAGEPVETRYDTPEAIEERIAQLGEAPGASRPGRRRRNWQIAVVTGLLGFIIAAVIITVPELVAGSSASGGGRDTTFFGGKKRASSAPTDTTTTTTPSEDGTETVPPASTVTVPPPAETITVPPPAEAPVPRGGGAGAGARGGDARGARHAAGAAGATGLSPGPARAPCAWPGRLPRRLAGAACRI